MIKIKLLKRRLFLTTIVSIKLLSKTLSYHFLSLRCGMLLFQLHLADFFVEQKNIPLVVSDSINSSIDLKELWICVFHKLADLCLDRRPAIRKSACQTLFNTIECHSEQFDEDTWSNLLWKVSLYVYRCLFYRIKSLLGIIFSHLAFCFMKHLDES